MSDEKKPEDAGVFDAPPRDDEVDQDIAANPWVLRTRLTEQAYKARCALDGRKPDVGEWMDHIRLSEEELELLNDMIEDRRGSHYIDDFVAIAKFGRTKRDWLARFLDLKNGIPSHDRFNAVLATIKPAEFEKCLPGWITSTMTSLARRCGGIRPAKRGTVARSIVTTISVRCRTTCRIVLAGRICVQSGS